MGSVEFKVENNIPKYRRQTQYLKKVKSFVDESASENDGLFTTEDIIENGWSNEIKEEKSEIEKLPKLVESDETLISLRCFKTMIEIYSDQNNFSDIIKLKGEDDEPKNVKGIVKDFWDNNEELARELFKPIWDAYNSTDKTEKSEKIALEKFNKQAETISLISKYMPTTEKLEKMLKNSNPAELSKQLKNFDNLTLQDYFMPPMILSLMFVDPVLSSEKVKEEIYEVLPEDTVVTSELIEEKKEYLSEKVKEEGNNTKIFKKVNEEVKAWINRAKTKKDTSCDDNYGYELDSLTDNFSLGKGIYVNDNKETAHKFYSLVNGELSSKLDKIPEVKMRWYDNFKRSSDYIDKHIRSQVSSFVKSLKSNSSKISSLKNGDQEGTENKLSDDDILRLIRYIIYDYNELIEKIISAGLDTNDIMINTLVKYIGEFLVTFKMGNESVSFPEKPKLKFKNFDSDSDSISSSNGNSDDTDDDDDDLDDFEDLDEDDDLDDTEDFYDDDFDDISELDGIPAKNNVKGRDRKFGSQKIKIKNYNTNINISNVKNKGAKGNAPRNFGTTINFNFYGNYGMGNGSPMMGPMFNTTMSPMMMPMINPQLMKLWVQQMTLMYGDFSQFKNGVPAIENYLTEKSDDSPKDTDVDNEQENQSHLQNNDWMPLPMTEDDLPMDETFSDNSEASSEICENRWKTGLRPLIRAMMLICMRGKSGRTSDNLMQVIKKCNVDIGTGDQQITKNGQNVAQAFDQIHSDVQTYAGAMILLIENSKKEYFNTKLFSPEQDVEDLEYILNLIKNLAHNRYVISSKEREHIVRMFNKKEYNPHDRLITKFEDLLSDKSDGNPHILNVLKQNNSNNTSPKTYK